MNMITIAAGVVLSLTLGLIQLSGSPVRVNTPSETSRQMSAPTDLSIQTATVSATTGAMVITSSTMTATVSATIEIIAITSLTMTETVSATTGAMAETVGTMGTGGMAEAAETGETVGMEETTVVGAAIAGKI